MARSAALCTLLACLVAMPAASAQEPGIDNPDTSSPATLYLHLIDVQDIPINTQKPDDRWTQDTAYGATTSTLSCTPEDPTGSANLRSPFHTFYGFSSPSYVEYLIEQGGTPRTHPERGISYDALLDASSPATLYWYLSVRNVAPSPQNGPDLDQVPLPVPNVVVQATMRTGDAISVDDRAYNTGEVLMQGRTPPATLLADQAIGAMGAPAPPEVRPLGQHDGKWLYEFAVPLDLQQTVIPRATGYNLRIDVYMDSPACTDPAGDGGALMPNLVGLHSSAAFRPRMELSVLNGVRIDALHPQFVGDDLVVHAAMNAVWGNYDVAEVSPYTPDVTAEGITLAITGPSAATSLALASMVQSTNPHYQHQDAVTQAYVWPYKLDRAEDGLYTVVLTVHNDQGTAVASAVAQFELGRNLAVGCEGTTCAPEGGPTGDGDRGAPGLAPLAMVTALAALGLLGRRRIS